MEYVIIGACIVVAIAGGIVLYVKNKRTKNELGNTAVVVSKTSSSKLQASEVANDPVIQIGILPADAISDETKLVEITDSKVLAHINNLVPGLAQAGNAANNATQAVKANGEVLYRAIIPAGAKLTDSKAMEGAVRGFYHGADGIRGHANLVAVEAQKGTAVAAMGVASMIVGQYYMTQINAELGVISDGISQIQNFQDNEYRSRVFSLVAHVKKIADFQTEILENDELRLSKIAQLDSLEEECTKLLGQANLTLAGFAKKSGLNYDGYEKALGNAQNWFMYQQSLLEILYKISDLRYTLHLGTVSREQCMALLPTYSKQVSDTQTRLTAWHEGTADRLGIEADESRRKRAGFDGVIHFIPGLFNDNLNFRGIEEKTASMITAQKAGHVCTEDDGQRYAERFIHAVESGQAKLVPGKTFRDYITDYMKADEHARINRVVRRLGCYYALLKELLDRHATPSNIDDRGTFTELKKSVNKTKAENFFRLVFKDDYVPLRLPIYSENYLRDFIFSGGKDPYLNVIEVEQTSAYTPDDAREYNKPKAVAGEV